MIVICVKLDNSTESTGVQTSDGWVTVGQKYVVLEIYGRGDTLKYRIIGNDNSTPAYQSAEQFEIASPDIPTGWSFRAHPNREWVLGPAAWSEVGFWNAYFDGDEAAITTFEEVVGDLGARRPRRYTESH